MGLRQRSREGLKSITDDRLTDLLDVLGDAKPDASNEAIGMVLAHVGGDGDLAAAALTMEPRPMWVVAMLER